jgi:hypothetical protein
VIVSSELVVTPYFSVDLSAGVAGSGHHRRGACNVCSSFDLFNRRRISMNQWEKLGQIADQLSHDEPPPFQSVPWHARNTLHFHEKAYYLCPCGKGFTDIASKRQHQIWGKQVKA